MKLFHYHLVTSRVREVEARYLGKLAFGLVEQQLRVQAHGGRRTFIATNAGYRLEVHPPREWLDELLEQRDVLQLTELQLLADDPEAKATVLAELLDTELDGTSVMVGDSVVSFIPGGPQGRPQLHGELLT